MNKTDPERECPAAKDECPLIPEIEALRERCQVLEELSYIDALTGLYNFRHLQRALDIEMERTRRTRLPTSLIMADLDHFKSINTNYGHESGNLVLAHIGRILRDSIRLIDIPCRYGGEEFALILPGTSLLQAANIAERLRETLSSRPVMLDGQKVTVTASFGVAVFGIHDSLTVSELLGKADEFLYQAKESGRNQVCTQEVCHMMPETGVTQDEKDALFSRESAEEGSS